MPTSVSFAHHLDGLALAAARLHAYGDAAGLDTVVPTAPDWTVRDLVAHQGMVHRWATGVIRGEGRADTDALEREGREALDPMAWLGHGADRLRAALRQAPPDLDVRFFLPDAPAPRHAWARRQCHETTVHAVDALAAKEGRMPTADEADVTAELAADGIDELLLGFATRRDEQLRTTGDPFEVEVRAGDTGDVWRGRVSEGPLQVVRGTEPRDADAVIHGSAAQLYLGLWNRGEELQVEGRDVVPLWRERMQVSWS